jgi:hypothetical protein
MTGLMCVVKNYVDVSILPFVGSHGKQKTKKEKKAGKATGEPKKKASSWELLTSSPRILNMTLMVRVVTKSPVAAGRWTACVHTVVALDAAAVS